MNTHMTRDSDVDRGAGSPVSEEVVRAARHIIRQSAVLFVGTAFILLGGYFFKIYLARMLGARGLGLFTIGMSTVAFFNMFATLGLPRTMYRLVPKYAAGGEYGRLTAMIYRSGIMVAVFSVCLGAVLFALRRIIALRLFHDAQVATVLSLLAFIVPLANMNFFLEQVMAGFKENARSKSINSFIVFPLLIVSSVFFLSLGLSLRGYLAANIVSVAAGTVLLLMAAKRILARHGVHGFSVGPALEREVKVLSLLMMASGLVAFTTGQLDKIVIGVNLGVEKVGIYSVALSTGAFLTVILQTVNPVFGPVIADLYASGRHRLLDELFKIVTKWVLGTTLPLFLVMVLMSPELMAVFGDDFRRGWPLLVVAACGQLVVVGTGSVGYMLFMCGQQKRVLKTEILSAGVTLVLLVALMPRLGAMGAVVATAAGLAVLNLVNLWQVRTVLSFWPYGKGVFLFLVPAGLAASMVLLGRSVSFWGLPAIAALCLAVVACYALFLLVGLTVGLDERERKIIAALWRRLLRQDRPSGAGEGTAADDDVRLP